ncbi:MAG: hypothetical protein AAGI50_10280 [Pseudomonadota bacterium]
MRGPPRRALLRELAVVSLISAVVPALLWASPLAIAPTPELVRFASVVIPAQILGAALLIGENLRRVRGLHRNGLDMRRDPRSYLLLLRSFRDSAAHEHVLRDISPEGQPFPNIQLSMIGPLERGLRDKDLALVVLGGPLSLPSDHRVVWLETSNEAWRAAFERAARGAAGIVFCPGTTDGLKAELAAIRAAGYAEKTVIYMHPTLEGRPWAKVIGPTAQADLWLKAKGEIEAEGSPVPDHLSDGMVFRLDDPTQPVPLGDHPPASLARAVVALLPKAPMSDPVSALIKDLKDARPVGTVPDLLSPPGGTLWLTYFTLSTSISAAALGLVLGLLRPFA